MNLQYFVRAAEEQKLRWTPADTLMGQRGWSEARKSLGFVPKPGTPTLQEREKEASQKLATLSVSLVGLPGAIDWRNQNNADFITSVKNQGSCGSCVAFAAIAVMEAQLQIRDNTPGRNIDLSEAYLWFCIAEAQQNRVCAGNTPQSGWWPEDALQALMNEGSPDDACSPYPDPDQPVADQPCNKCADWQNRMVRISNFRSFSAVNDMKSWLANKGPLVTTISVYEDFLHYSTGVYEHISVPGERPDGHCIAIIGYDDAQGAWLVKNSWGTRAWGDNGFGWIGYGQIGIEYAMFGVEV